MIEDVELLVRLWFPARDEAQTRPQPVAGTLKGWIDENGKHVMTFMYMLDGKYFSPQGKGDQPKDALRNMCFEAERMFSAANAELSDLLSDRWEREGG
jgi:hypothetical protein